VQNRSFLLHADERQNLFSAFRGKVKM